MHHCISVVNVLYDAQPQVKKTTALRTAVFFAGIPGRNRTGNDALGEHCYIHLTTETCEVVD